MRKASIIFTIAILAIATVAFASLINASAVNVTITNINTSDATVSQNATTLIVTTIFNTSTVQNQTANQTINQTTQVTNVTVTNNTVPNSASVNLTGNATYTQTNQAASIATEALTVLLYPQSSSIDAGSSITFTNTTSGQGPATAFTYYANNTSGITSQGNTFTFTAPGTYSITLTASSGNETNSSSSTVTVNPSIVLSAPSIDPLDKGQTANIVDTIPTTDTAPYSYKWLVETPGSNTFATASTTICPTPSGTDQSGGTEETCQFVTNSNTQTGTYNFEFQVTDSASHPVTTTSAPSPLLVNATPAATLSASNSVIDLGQSAILLISITNGVGPFTANLIYSNNDVLAGTFNVPYKGTASYTFTPPSTGNYAFSVQATDLGTTHAFTFNSAAVTISVDQSLSFGSPSITIPVSTIESGQSETIIANVIGGTGPYTFVWKLNGNTLASTTNTITFNGNSSDIGNDIIHVTVLDHAGQQVSGSGNVIVNNDLSFGSPAVIISTGAIDSGQSETIIANVIGGTGPYTFVWKLNGNTLASTTNTITFNGNSSDLGNDNIQVTVTDYLSQQASGTGNIIVNSNPSFGSPTITVSNSVIDSGQSETIVANVIGGTGPYTFIWTLNGNTLASTSNTITFNGNSSDIGTDNIMVTVTDHNSQTASANEVITVNNALISTSISLVPTNAIVDSGQTLNFTYVITGGTAPYAYTITFNTPNSISNVIVSPATSSSGNILVTFNGAGTDDILFSVSDAYGEDAAVNSIITMNNAPEASSLVPGSASITSGASDNFTFVITEGTGPFVANLLIAGSPTPVLSINGLTDGNVLTASFVPPQGSDSYNVVITDLGTTTPYIFNTTNATITVTAAPSSGGGPGSGGGSPGGGGPVGGGSSGPTITHQGSCTDIANLTISKLNTITVGGKTYAITVSFIAPNDAGFMVNSQTYTVDSGQKVSIDSNTTLELQSISYIPIGHTIDVAVCSVSSATNTGPGTSGNTNVSLKIYPNGTIALNGTKPGDAIELIANGTVVDTGIGSLAFNALALLPGTYSITGKDTTTDTTTSGQQFSRPQYSGASALSFVKTCINQTVTSNSFSCTTTAQVASMNNQLTATLYVNGAKVTSTTGLASSTETQVGQYKYTFTTLGNANYSAANITYTSVIAANALAEKASTKLSGSLLSGALLPVLGIAVIAIITGIAYVAYRRRRRGAEEIPTS